MQPNLGVAVVGQPPDEKSFVVADIPGLIEGAHTGAGLGTQFLRHIERNRLLVHLVDVSDGSGRPDPVKDVEVIAEELASFGAHLDEKPVIMVASKIDVADKEKLAKLKRYCKKKNLELFPISAVTGKGIDDLKYAIAERVEELRSQSASPNLLRTENSQLRSVLIQIPLGMSRGRTQPRLYKSSTAWCTLSESASMFRKVYSAVEIGCPTRISSGRHLM